MDHILLYCGVDFGTEGTGVAIATSAKNIYEHSWSTVGNRTGSDKSKTRTAVLVKASDYSPIAFGDVAYDMYHERMLADPQKTRTELLFFDYFKMSLSNDEKNDRPNRHPSVTAVTGETVSADKIFRAAFQSIHKSVFDKLSSASSHIQPKNVVWIITIPTIWSEAAKQIVRESARSAFPDTPDQQIKIALEPEAAALCCRAQQLESQLSFSSAALSRSDLLKPGAHFIVADLGAGTADFSELAVETDGRIRETFASSGGTWGGHLVEKRLIHIFEHLFGKETMSTFRKNYPVDYQELERSIRILKHRVDPNAKMFQRLSLPFAFIQLTGLRQRLKKHEKHTGDKELPLIPIITTTTSENCKQNATIHNHDSNKTSNGEDVKNAAKSIDGDESKTALSSNAFASNGGAEGKSAAAKEEDLTKANGSAGTHREVLDFLGGDKTVSYTSGGFLKLSYAFVLSLFDTPKHAILSHLGKILDRNLIASTLFLVGGFSESPVIQQAVDDLLAQRRRTTDVKSAALVPVRVLPLFPSLCVMNGAVHFGINPHLISQRIAKMSFGIQIAKLWDSQTMSGQQKEKRLVNGQIHDYCLDLFSPFCQAGELISVDQEKTETFSPQIDRQQMVRFTLLATAKKNVQFSSDPSIITIGTVDLCTPWPKDSQDLGHNRRLVVSMRFGSTEIFVSAREETSGNKLQCIIDCLDFDLDASKAKLSLS